MKKTINYYNTSAAAFFANTVSVEFSEMQKRFTDKLPAGATILDFGCGSGRDTKAFLEQGFCVEAVDGSEELCRLASEFAGISVRWMFFQELSDVERFDGIWACSSILHMPRAELGDVLWKMARALKSGGIIYTSFKYGNFEGERNGRYFTDLTEESFAGLLGETENLQIEEQWVTADVRPGREEERWLNLILRKM